VTDDLTSGGELKYKARGNAVAVIEGTRTKDRVSSRRWAAKGTLLLGVSAVIAESLEAIHRSISSTMGVLPLQFQRGCHAASL